MIFARPTVAEERWLTLADRYRALRPAIEAAGNTGNWKSTTFLARCVGFVLALIGVGMLAGVLRSFPQPLLFSSIVLFIAAEWLIARRRVFRSGIEEGLYVAAAMSLVAQIFRWMGNDEYVSGVTLVAVALLLVGWRLLNPIFTTLAALAFSVALALQDSSRYDSDLSAIQASILCAVVAVIALIASGREWRRPSHDHMLDGLVIVMPWAAWGWLAFSDELEGGTEHYALLALALVFLLLNLVAGVKRRQHAPFVGAGGNLLCAAWALHELLPWPLHWQLILAGGALLIVAIGLDRSLRDRAGITSRKLAGQSGIDLAQLAGAAHITPAAVAAPAPAVQGQGGDFGGGGASGRF